MLYDTRPIDSPHEPDCSFGGNTKNRSRRTETSVKIRILAMDQRESPSRRIKMNTKDRAAIAIVGEYISKLLNVEG